MTEHTIDHKRLSNRILAALALGLIFGMLINLTMADQAWVNEWLIHGLLATVGEIFMRFLSMLVVPLVLVSLITGVCSLGDPKRLGRLGGKAVALFLMTSAIAITLSLTAGLVFKPGVGANPEAVAHQTIAEQPSFSEVLISMVPRNPFASMAAGEMLPLIVFALMIGLAIAYSGSRGERIGHWFEDMFTVVMQLVGFVMRMAPYGVFALITVMAATTGWSTFLGVLKYVVIVLVTLVVHALIVYSLMVRFLAGLNPFTFVNKMREVMMFAFSTASSAATMPVTLNTVEKRLGVDNRVASFIVPLGTTINMDGTAIMQGIAVAFIAQYFGIDLSLTQLLMIVLMVVMASIGAAGVPGAGLVLLAGVLASVDLPPEGIALILGVDRLLDMTRTVTNVMGDAVIATIVARSEGMLDEGVFNDLATGSTGRGPNGS